MTDDRIREINPGHALRWNIKNALEKKAVLPSATDMRILRRAAMGAIHVLTTEVEQDGRKSTHYAYAYEDGTPVSLHWRSPNRHFNRLVKEGWLIPEWKDLRENAPNPQIYHARRASDLGGGARQGSPDAVVADGAGTDVAGTVTGTDQPAGDRSER